MPENSYQASRYPIPEFSTLPEDIQDTILAVQEKSGFIPNIFLALCHRPEEFRAFFAYHDALMFREGGLTKADREMIVTATSAENSCLYCVVAHGAVLRIRSKKPHIADQVATNYRMADLSPREKAMLDFAVKVSKTSYLVDETDFDTLKQHGFSDDDIWDIGAITAFFGMSNRLASTFSMMPNAEFYSLGR